MAWEAGRASDGAARRKGRAAARAGGWAGDARKRWSGGAGKVRGAAARREGRAAARAGGWAQGETARGVTGGGAGRRDEMAEMKEEEGERKLSWRVRGRGKREDWESELGRYSLERGRAFFGESLGPNPCSIMEERANKKKGREASPEPSKNISAPQEGSARGEIFCF